jgi:hypothetical protein
MDQKWLKIMRQEISKMALNGIFSGNNRNIEWLS